MHPAQQVLPDKGSSASVVGSSKCPWPEGHFHSPLLEKVKEMPGGTGQKQKSRDRIYSYEHMTLLADCTYTLGGQLFLLKNFSSANKNLAPSYLAPPAPSRGPQVGAGSI